MRFLSLSMLAVGLTLGASVSADELTLEKSSSTIDFVGSKPEGKHKGGFNKFKADVSANFDDPTKSSLAIEIDARSIWSDDDKLTNHLKSPDFFDVRNNPTITFESTKITPKEKEGNKASADITGKMTMLGKTVEIEIPIEAEVSDTTVELTADFTIDRTKWGMTYGQGKIDNDVKVKVSFTLKR